ncbi:MAG: ABC transporter ATP-binding protein [Verrucomicrobiales bacterium]|nr:ABC transporter ATP-binding protein [Verrucomicrobiales bacterium]
MQRYLRTIQLGIKSLLLHKLRSGLTMLGIIFGVCSVIAMLAIGEGASYEAQEAIKKLGSNNIIIRSLKPPASETENTTGRSFVLEYGLTYDDSARLRETIKGVDKVLPMRIVRENARFAQNMLQCQIIGTLPYYLEITALELKAGRFLTVNDEKNQDNICAITEHLASRLFPYQNPLNQSIRVGSMYFQVVGVVRETSRVEERTKTSKSDGETINNNIYIPMSTSRKRFGELIVKRSSGSFSAERIELHQITVRMVDTDAVEAAQPQIETAMIRFHDKTDYEIIVPLQLLRQAEETKRIFNIVLGSIAAISLLVGGIGIMNIMMASVTERTREIGVRRALGAKKRDIVTQFLVETVTLSVFGGVVGVLIGIATPIAVEHFADMKTIVTIWSVIIAFGISAAIGVIFGLYPASAAADLDPIEALRHE